jgi:hypothetical protein
MEMALAVWLLMVLQLVWLSSAATGGQEVRRTSRVFGEATCQGEAQLNMSLEIDMPWSLPLPSLRDRPVGYKPYAMALRPILGDLQFLLVIIRPIAPVLASHLENFISAFPGTGTEGIRIDMKAVIQDAVCYGWDPTMASNLLWWAKSRGASSYFQGGQHVDVKEIWSTFSRLTSYLETSGGQRDVKKMCRDTLSLYWSMLAQPEYGTCETSTSCSVAFDVLAVGCQYVTDWKTADNPQDRAVATLRAWRRGMRIVDDFILSSSLLSPNKKRTREENNRRFLIWGILDLLGLHVYHDVMDRQA